MSADALATLGARASAGMVLAPKSRIFPLQHQKELRFSGKSALKGLRSLKLHLYLLYSKYDHPTKSSFLNGCLNRVYLFQQLLVGWAVGETNHDCQQEVCSTASPANRTGRWTRVTCPMWPLRASTRLYSMSWERRRRWRSVPEFWTLVMVNLL